MPKQFNRTDRLSSLIQRELSRLIQREVRDPRLEKVFISILAVKIAKDLSHAKIYVTTFGEVKLKKEEIIKILNGAANYLRSELRDCLSIRTIPQLHFVYDYSVQKAEDLTELIDKTILEDENRNKSKDDDVV